MHSLLANVLNSRDHNVALIFDEMTIKQGLIYNSGSDNVEGFENFGNVGKTRYIANHAAAYMICGLASKWKQPIGYLLSSGPMKSNILQSLTKTSIGKIDKTGLNVVALICDQGSNNRCFLQKYEKVSVMKPYIQYND